MNKSKRIILIIVIILNFFAAARNIALAVLMLINNTFTSWLLIQVMYYIIGAIAYCVSSGMLIFAISNKGEFFRSRSGYYTSALILNLILGTFSISSVLLFVTLFMSDLVWVKPHDDVYFEKKESDKEKIQREIAKLRRLKEEGKISEEDYNAQLIKLI